MFEPLRGVLRRPLRIRDEVIKRCVSGTCVGSHRNRTSAYWEQGADGNRILVGVTVERDARVGKSQLVVY